MAQPKPGSSHPSNPPILGPTSQRSVGEQNHQSRGAKRSLDQTVATPPTAAPGMDTTVPNTPLDGPPRKRRRRKSTRVDHRAPDDSDSRTQLPPSPSDQPAAAPIRSSESIRLREPPVSPQMDESSVAAPQAVRKRGRRHHAKSHASRRFTAPTDPTGLRRSPRGANT